jgi:hypothetical protein
MQSERFLQKFKQYRWHGLRILDEWCLTGEQVIQCPDYQNDDDDEKFQLNLMFFQLPTEGLSWQHSAYIPKGKSAGPSTRHAGGAGI